MQSLTNDHESNLETLDFSAALTHASDLSRTCLQAHLAPVDGAIADAMRYALEGGKGLRGFLVIESAHICGLDRTVAAPAAAAIEAMHTYSLIHDDLPAMDDDDLRRSKPTVHRKWDEASAILAGDALQSLAFELLGSVDCSDARKLRLITDLAKAAGVRGMVDGQAMDIAAETADTPLTLDEIVTLQARKTGALIRWSAQAGAIMAGHDPKPFRDYGDHLGLAFQIWDDVLDVEGDVHLTGKAVGKDEDRGKATFVSLLGLDAAKARAAQLVHNACESLSVYGDDAEVLREAAHFVITRRN